MVTRRGTRALFGAHAELGSIPLTGLTDSDRALWGGDGKRDDHMNRQGGTVPVPEALPPPLAYHMNRFI